MNHIQKSKKIFKNKKDLIKYLQELPSEVQEFELEHQQEKLAFSQKHKDKSIIIQSSSQATVDSSRYGSGQITLNKKLQKLTEWRMKMCSISLAAQFGICEIDNKTNKIGDIYGLYSQGYWPARNIQTGYQFENDSWIKMIYNPEEGSLVFFNQKTKKSFQIQIPEKTESFDYYPYAFLYKATVYLNEEPDDDPFSAEYYDQMYEEHLKAIQEERIRLEQEEHMKELKQKESQEKPE